MKIKFGIQLTQAGNNCTMYNAQASGGDSVLEFSPVNSAASEYLIKMFHKDKYLHVATDDRGANVYWSDINSGSTVWTFVDESDVIFAPSGPGEMFSKDSSLVTKVMPAHQNNFTKNRAGENAAIEKITIHHMAGNLSIETLGNIWQKPDRRGSSHYGINGNNVGQYVKESDIAWTDGNWESNRRSVTIET
ncbi:MAG: N-acetylmuramoyl-L-alanine amidase, partial [Oscillospiraceae bacterium]